MQETGVVRELRGPKALVLVKRQSACDSCASAGSGCKGTQHGMEIEAFNDAGAAAGDTVRISFRAFTYLKGAILIYGVPATALIVGAVLGKEVLSGYWPGIDADLASAVAGFGLMGLSFITVRLIIGLIEKKRELVPVIEEIIEQSKN
jgi:sigma-E factor negative regulatory protein RseC